MTTRGLAQSIVNKGQPLPFDMRRGTVTALRETDDPPTVDVMFAGEDTASEGLRVFESAAPLVVGDPVVCYGRRGDFYVVGVFADDAAGWAGSGGGGAGVALPASQTAAGASGVLAADDVVHGPLTFAAQSVDWALDAVAVATGGRRLLTDEFDRPAGHIGGAWVSPWPVPTIEPGSTGYVPPLIDNGAIVCTSVPPPGKFYADATWQTVEALPPDVSVTYVLDNIEQSAVDEGLSSDIQLHLYRSTSTIDRSSIEISCVPMFPEWLEPNGGLSFGIRVIDEDGASTFVDGVDHPFPVAWGSNGPVVIRVTCDGVDTVELYVDETGVLGGGSVILTATVPSIPPGDRVGFLMTWNDQSLYDVPATSPRIESIQAGTTVSYTVVDEFQRADGPIFTDDWEVFDPFDSESHDFILPTIQYEGLITPYTDIGETELHGAARWKGEVHGPQALELVISNYGQGTFEESGDGEGDYFSYVQLYLQATETADAAYLIEIEAWEPYVPDKPNGYIKWQVYALGADGLNAWYGEFGFWALHHAWAPESSFTVRAEAEPGLLRLYLDDELVHETTSIPPVSGPKVGFTMSWYDYFDYLGLGDSVRVERATISSDYLGLQLQSSANGAAYGTAVATRADMGHADHDSVLAAWMFPVPAGETIAVRTLLEASAILNDDPLYNRIGCFPRSITTGGGSGTTPEPEVSDRMLWRGLWTPGVYAQHDVARDGLWTMVCINPDGSSEKPAPTPIGPAVWMIPDDTPTWADETDTFTELWVGLRATALNPGYLNAVRYWDGDADADVYSDLLLRVNPGTVDEVVITVAREIQDSGAGVWVAVPFSVLRVPQGTVVDAIRVIRNQSTTTTTVASYNYQKPTNLTVPTTGRITHALNARSIMRVHKTDDTAVDRSALLAGLEPGDEMEMGDSIWTVQGTVDAGTYVEVTVTPAVGDSHTGTQSFTFRAFGATSITYPYVASHFAPVTEPPADGLVIDPTTMVETLNDNAYGIDIRVQRALVSEDWQTVAFSGGLL